MCLGVVEAVMFLRDCGRGGLNWWGRVNDDCARESFLKLQTSETHLVSVDVECIQVLYFSCYILRHKNKG
jgi:hypothetical protein